VGSSKYKQRNINVVFSQSGSQQRGSSSDQKWLWRVLRSAEYPVQWIRLVQQCRGRWY